MHLPQLVSPSESWQHIELWRRVREALYAIPAHFKSHTVIEGILATDLQTLNAPLGATIEDQVLSTLNQMRPVWDPHDQYQAYAFYRQRQTFPDVLLKRDTDGEDIVIGIELKGWYLLAKEGMPNFRFKATPAACADADLLVTVPWVLSNVLSGSPVAFKPFVTSSKCAALYRNFWWQHERGTDDDPTIDMPSGVHPYPSARSTFLDKPSSDQGGNFGRIARTGLMSDYLLEMMETPVAGIPVREWIAFLKGFG